MKKPEGYDSVNLNAERVSIGPHTAVIKGVEEKTSKGGKPMIVVYIDFGKGDEQEGMFKRIFDSDEREEKFWPFQATQYILTENPYGGTNRSFKAFITSVENSNGFNVDWDAADFGKQFKGKKVGVMYGTVEEEYNGQRNLRQRIRWFFDIHKKDDQVTPDTKWLPTQPQQSSVDSAFMDVGTEALPFA